MESDFLDTNVRTLHKMQSYQDAMSIPKLLSSNMFCFVIDSTVVLHLDTLSLK